MRSTAFLLGVLIGLTGCATDNASAPPPATILPGQAAVTVTRSTSPMYFAVPASLDVNGAKVAGLAVGESWSGPVPPGNVVLTVSAWSAPGYSSYRFNAEPGKSYRFAIAPRAEQTFAGAAGGAVGQAIEGGGPFKVVPLN